MSDQKLPFVSDKILLDEVKKVLLVAQAAVNQTETKLFSNVIDPFSAVFDSMRQGISLADWLEQEKARQIQKTMQNAVGEFHQAILGNVAGWTDLKVGGVVDLKNSKMMVIAELKNKHNTTKGNHKKVIYDELKTLLVTTYSGYTAYYVEIIPKPKTPYNKPFVPSDNETSQRRPENQKIRIIDGRSFYSLVTGQESALADLYRELPIVIAEALNSDSKLVTDDPLYGDLFAGAYSV